MASGLGSLGLPSASPIPSQASTARRASAFAKATARSSSEASSGIASTAGSLRVTDDKLKDVRLSISDLVVVQSTFEREVLEPGKVYFLNTQKLSKSSLLVRGHDPDDEGIEKDGQIRLMPDSRSFTIWDTVQNTIDDPALTLYLVLDEAHRGMPCQLET